MQQDNRSRCERRAESRRSALEAEKVARRQKYEELLESRKQEKERLRIERAQIVEARQLKSQRQEELRQASRERAKLEAEKQAMIPALRLEVVERKKELRKDQQIRTQAEYERRLRLTADAVEKQRLSERWPRERERAESLERYALRQEEVQHRERIVKARQSGDRESNQLRVRKLNAVLQARAQAQRQKVDIADHALVKQRLERQAETQRTSQVRVNCVKDQIDKDGQVLRAKREHVEKIQRLLREREAAIIVESRALSLEALERKRESTKIQHDREVEKRSVQSARLHDRSWQARRQRTWGTRGCSLAKSDGDIMSLRLASMLSPRGQTR